MIYWVDAQLPPQLADWLRWTFKVEAYALRDAEDEQIFHQARQAGIVLISKDSDFVEKVLRLGTPPQLLWVTCGNVTNRRLQSLFIQVFPKARQLLATGEAIVEIADIADSF
jgi:predicted nuclease of predicted toxin-antitoxin system